MINSSAAQTPESVGETNFNANANANATANNGLVVALNRVQAVIEFNLDGTILTANDNFLATLGYSLDEIKGKHHRIFCEEEYAASDEYKLFWDKLGRGEFDSGRYKRLDKNGKEIWISASYNPIFDANGKPCKVAKFATDITAQRKRDFEFEGKINAISRVQAVIEFNLDGTIITANDNFLSTVGYYLDEIKGKHHRMFCEEEYVASDEYRSFWEKLASGEFYSGEYKRIGKNGKEIWINASYNPILDANGKPFKVVKFATDITQGKLMNAEFEGKINAISRSQAIIEFKLDGTIITANDNFLSTVGYALEDITGRHHRIFCDEDYVETYEYKLFWEKLASGEFNSGEYKRIGNHGKEIWINASYNPIFDAAGKPYKVVKFATDITETKLFNAEFEGQISAISKAQAIIEFDTKGNILMANDNFLATLGYSLAEIKGKHHRIFCETDYVNTKEYDEFWEKLARGEYDFGEYKRIGKGGKEIWINASYNPILDANGKPYKVVKFATDVTVTKLENSEYQGKIDAISKAQAVIEFDTEGTILTANDNFLSTVGYSLKEIKGKHHKMFCEEAYTATDEYKLFWIKLANGEFDSGRYKRIGSAGKVVWIQATYNPIFDLNRKIFKVVKFAVDITNQVELEAKVAQIAVDFSAKAQEMSVQAGTVSDGAQSLGATTEEMNASVEELSASIDSIAHNTKQADEIAKNTQNEANLGSQAIAKSIESMELINKSSEDISEIVKVISEIASQTNLLAFNAAIEAARAGEHGLGFSVVADEVRKLAERSSLATKDITKLINETVKRVAQGGEISKEAAEAFKTIVDGVSKTTKSISEISVAAQEQQIAAKDVSNAIQQVVDSTEESAIASEAIARSTDDLAAGSEKLRQEMKKFAS